jgi:hypothetical protein
MGHLLDTTIEVTYNGKTTRVAKQDAHLYIDKKVKEVKPKDKK